MAHKELNRELGAFVRHDRIRLKRAKVLLDQHRIELILTGLKNDLAESFLLQNQGRERERLALLKEFLCISMQSGFSGAQRIWSMGEMCSLAARPTQCE